MYGYVYDYLYVNFHLPSSNDSLGVAMKQWYGHFHPKIHIKQQPELGFYME